MKSYDETVSTVFDRIYAYNVKKQHRTVLARRITASCCAVSLLGGSLWYLNHAPEDAPVTMITDGNTDTTTVRNSTFPSSATATETQDTLSTTASVTSAPSGSTTESKTKAPSTTITTTPTQTTVAPSVSTPQSATESTTATTTPQKILITADEPDDYGSGLSELPLKEYPKISPALQKKMEIYSGVDAIYSVIVEVVWTIEEGEAINRFPDENAELLLLKEEKNIAYEIYINAKEQYGWTTDVWEKYRIFKNIQGQYTQLHDKLVNEYAFLLLDQHVKELSDWSNSVLIPLATDSRFYPFFSPNPDYAFFMELTANEINELAALNYYVRLVYPGGDMEVVVPDMPE